MNPPPLATSSVTDRVANGLLIYDADCGFCTTCAHWFADHIGDTGCIAPWQSLDLESLGLTPELASTAVCWVKGSNIDRGADAVAAALRAGKGPWSIAGKLLGVAPLIWLGRLVYPIIAKYRYRLPGATDSCRI